MRLLVALAAVLAAGGCKGAGDAGPMPQPSRAAPPGFEDVDTAERPDAAPAAGDAGRQPGMPAGARATIERAGAGRDAAVRAPDDDSDE